MSPVFNVQRFNDECAFDSRVLSKLEKNSAIKLAG